MPQSQAEISPSPRQRLGWLHTAAKQSWIAEATRSASLHRRRRRTDSQGA
jgi:hypothetical protein